MIGQGASYCDTASFHLSRNDWPSLTRLSSEINLIYSLFPADLNMLNLRILATLEAKNAKISNFWTFCTVILLILHVSKIHMTAFWSMHLLVKRRCISWITGQNVQNLLILAVLAISVASILKVNLIQSPWAITTVRWVFQWTLHYHLFWAFFLFTITI